MKERVNKITEQKNGFDRILYLSPPWDKRSSDPKKNYGISGMYLYMVLKKENKAVQFACRLPVFLPHVERELWNNRHESKYNRFKFMATDVGYHSPHAMYDGQTAMDCDILEEGQCFYDGSSLRAEEWGRDFLEYGMDYIWERLEKEWESRFLYDGLGELE